jgi:hypothetical protein
MEYVTLLFPNRKENEIPQSSVHCLALSVNFIFGVSFDIAHFKAHSILKNSFLSYFVTCKHGPRQTINCQMHIVTSFDGPTQRIWSGAAALDGAQGLIFQASIQIPNHAAGVLISTQG